MPLHCIIIYFECILDFGISQIYCIIKFSFQLYWLYDDISIYVNQLLWSYAIISKLRIDLNYFFYVLDGC